jgi:hypothetical protein
MAQRVPRIGRMNTENVTAMEAPDVTEIEERIESQKESAALMRKALDCECPDTSCPVAHES